MKANNSIEKKGNQNIVRINIKKISSLFHRESAED